MEGKKSISQSFREAHKKLSAEGAAVMDELEKACSETEEALQKALDSLKEVREYSSILSEANSKTEGKGSKLMELNIACEMEVWMDFKFFHIRTHDKFEGNTKQKW